MNNASKTFALVAFAILVGALADCAGKTTDENSGAIAGSTGGGSPGSGGSGGASSGTGGSIVGSTGGSAGAGTAGSSGTGGTIFCGVETCGPATKCCPGTGTCIDPKRQGCAGIGCAVAHCVGPNCPDASPPDAGSCCKAQGLLFCPTNSSCYHPGCQNCCPPDVQCNQQADCPSGFSCCYNSRRCYNPAIDSCGGSPAKCATDGSCPGNLTCCKQHDICCDPASTDCCPTNCVPSSASCSGQLPCCNGLMCCGPPVVFADAAPSAGFCGQACPVSDRNAKHDITPIDPDQILESIAKMPISEWSYNDQEPSVRHIGPMAQDFHSAFDVGSSDKCIPTVDENGVALAAIQALYQRVSHLDEESRDLRQKNDALRREVEQLRRVSRK